MSMILASGSPRRRELLNMLGAQDLKIIPAQGEEAPPQGASPAETVISLAKAKADEVFSRLQSSGELGENDIIIAADTVVELDGAILGKPKDTADARRMLHSLSGRTHRVYTGVAVLSAGGALCQHEETLVRFRELDDGELDRYIATGEPMDKAGSYGIQGKGSLLVEALDGDYFNVMGLPVCRLGKMLKKLGVDLI